MPNRLDVGQRSNIWYAEIQHSLFGVATCGDGCANPLCKPGLREEAIKLSRPFAILLAGPVGMGAVCGIASLFVGSIDEAISTSFLVAQIFLPIFAGVAWAVAPTRFSGDIKKVKRRWFRAWVVVVGAAFLGMLYIAAWMIFDLRDRFGNIVGGLLLIAALLAVFVMSNFCIVMGMRILHLKRLISEPNTRM